MKWYRVGKVKEAHGLKGEVYILVFSGEFHWAHEQKPLQVRLTDSEGQPKSQFTIKKFRPHKKGFVALFEGLSNRNQSEALKGQLVEIPAEYLKTKSEETNEFYLEELRHFQVMDKQEGLMGVVVDFSTNQVQDLLVIEHEGWRFEAPLVDEFVLEVDKDKKIIRTNFPPGIKELGHEV